MKVCDCYRQLEPIQLMVGECLGAKNKPKVDCCGDESRCLFYSDRRRKAKAVTNADRIRAMTDEELAVWIHDQIIDRNVGIPSGTWLDWLKQEANDET